MSHHRGWEPGAQFQTRGARKEGVEEGGKGYRISPAQFRPTPLITDLSSLCLGRLNLKETLLRSWHRGGYEILAKETLKVGEHWVSECVQT